MPILIVVNDTGQWPLKIPDVEVVDARSYLTRPEYSEMRGVKLFNLCRIKAVGLSQWAAKEAQLIRQRYFSGKFIPGSGPVEKR